MNSITHVVDVSGARFVAIDWGTSSFRAWLMSADGTPLAESRGSEGMLHCMDTGFEPVLREHLRKLGAPAGLPIVICGMAGAKQGWKEASYLQVPTHADALHRGAVKLDAAEDIRILPGIAQSNAVCPDVMRGEETQLLGAMPAAYSGLICLPGTHSKWIRVEAGCVETFSTYMTGELFAVLGKHSILALAVESGQSLSPDSAAFRAGLEAGMKDGVEASLFRLRAAQLLGFEQRADGAPRLSGLLIGAELASAARRYGAPGSILLVAAGVLAQLYEFALSQAGFEVTMVDAEMASQAGLAKAAIKLWGKQF